MQNAVQFIQTTPIELAELINNRVKSQLDDFKRKLDLNQVQIELLTRQETCELLKIDQSTLYHWTKKGKVTCYGIENRRYYKRSEIMECLTKLK